MATAAACLVLLIGTAQMTVQADPPTSPLDADASSVQPESAAQEAEKRENDTKAQLVAIANQGMDSFKAIKSGHLKFRIIRVGKSSLNAELTPERCAELLAKYDLAKSPDSFRDLCHDLSGKRRVDGKPFPPDALKPWGEVDYQFTHMDNDFNIREAVTIRGETNVNVRNGQIALYWNDANSQLDVSYGNKDKSSRTGIIHPLSFWRPLFFPVDLFDDNTSISKEEDIIRIMATKRGTHVWSVDANTGFVLASDESRGIITGQSRWLEWTESAEGIKYPQVVAKFGFRDGTLIHVDISVVTEARFNHPIPPATFRLDERTTNNTLLRSILGAD